MKVPVEWLREYVTMRLSPKALAERLTMAGLEVVGLMPSDGGPVLDLEVTPNRADCLSIIGIAREVAAITGQRVKIPSTSHGRRPAARERASARVGQRPDVTIRIEDRKGCRRYIGRLIEGVTIGPSPDWMQRRLLACGARPINNIVDITNYVLFESGQPLHAFDVDQLARGTILVRRAQAREPITTLDGVNRALSSEMLVIADAKQAVAVAGVMGGVGSEVRPGTTRVLLESALFDPVSVRRTARTLGLTSESSYRFERGVDPGGVETASARAASLLCELAGGTLRAIVDAGAKPLKRTVIALDGARVNRWLGTDMSPATMRTTLAKLSCRVAASGEGNLMRVSVPSFRQDLQQDVDLAEELARLQGYERLPSAVPASPIPRGQGGDSTQFWRLQSLRCLCASLGLSETISWSLVSEAELARCGFSPAQAIRLLNPLSHDHAYLRPSLVMGLLQTVRHNLTQGAAGVRVFELGNVASPQKPVESLRLGLALSGGWARDWRTHELCDFFRLKGLIETLMSRLCHGEARLVHTAHRWAEPTVSTTVQLNGHDLGVAGQVSRVLADALDLEQAVWVAELSVSGLLAAKRSTATISAPPAFPPVKRDLSLFVDERTPFEAIRRAICDVGGRLAAHVQLIDRYTGRSIPQGKYSLTFSIEYRDPARTLTAAEVEVLHQRIGQELTSRFQATVR